MFLRKVIFCIDMYMEISFKKWLLEVGMGGGGPGSGIEPPKQDPTKTGSQGFADYHGKDGTDPRNPNGQLPPIPKKMKKKMKRK